MRARRNDIPKGFYSNVIFAENKILQDKNFETIVELVQLYKQGAEYYELKGNISMHRNFIFKIQNLIHSSDVYKILEENKIEKNQKLNKVLNNSTALINSSRPSICSNLSGIKLGVNINKDNNKFSRRFSKVVNELSTNNITNKFIAIKSFESNMDSSLIKLNNNLKNQEECLMKRLQERKNKKNLKIRSISHKKNKSQNKSHKRTSSCLSYKKFSEDICENEKHMNSKYDSRKTTPYNNEIIQILSNEKMATTECSSGLVNKSSEQIINSKLNQFINMMKDTLREKLCFKESEFVSYLKNDIIQNIDKIQNIIDSQIDFEMLVNDTSGKQYLILRFNS